MAKKSVVVFVLLLAVVHDCFGDHHRAANSIEDNEEGLSFSQCDEKDTSLSCQSIRIARNVFQQLMKAKSSDGIGDLKIIEGVELVRTQSLGDGGGRSLNDGTVLGKLAGYLQSHEIRVKLPDLIGKDDMNGVFSETLRSFDKQSGLVETGRKKGKGDGGIMLMGLMMAKTLAAIGFGGLGLLTMKALMVSALALMLSAIIGIKKLASSGDDHDGGHQVHYVQAHDHHRRRRMIADHTNPDMPYSGWTHYVTSY